MVGEVDARPEDARGGDVAGEVGGGDDAAEVADLVEKLAVGGVGESLCGGDGRGDPWYLTSRRRHIMGASRAHKGISIPAPSPQAVRPSSCTNWLLGSLSAIEAISVLAPRRSPRLDRPTAGMGCVRTGPSS